ncbi:MAG: hypothetical protein B7C24_16395, partial [Bacteroidetes bacterium 4572_77]
MYLDIYFLPDATNYGWACGYDGNVLRTTDQGETWLGARIGNASQLESVHFVNKDIGFTSDAGGRCYKSTDGGRNWRDCSPMGLDDCWGLHFFNEKIGYLLGGETCSGMGYPLKFYKTTDLGETWTVYQVSPPMATKLSDPLILDESGRAYAASSGLIWETTDAGSTWKILYRTGGYDWHEEITYVDGSFCVPISNGCTGTWEDNGGMRMLTDEHNWIEHRTGRSMYGAFLFDADRGWVCGSNKALYYTDDGGRTWEEKNCGIHPESSLDDIWFINDTLGWVVGDGIYKYTPRDTIAPKILPDSIICVDSDYITVWVPDNPDLVHWFRDDELVARDLDTMMFSASDKISAYVEYWDRPFCGYLEDYEVKIAAVEQPIIEIGDSVQICKGDTAYLNCLQEYDDYYWSNGERTRSIEVDEPGTYSLSVIDSNGCPGATSALVDFYPNTNIDITTGNTDICVGEFVDIELRGDIVMHIDPDEENSQRLFEGIDSSYFDDMIAIFSS